MDLILNNIRIPIEKDGMAEYLQAASGELEINADSIAICRILSKSLDIRNTEQFYFKIILF